MKWMLSACVVAAGCGCALGDFMVPDGLNVGWVRGVTSRSSYAQWDRFVAPAGPNPADVGSYTAGLPVAAPAFDVVDTSGSSFVTSGGNIYSFAAPLNITATVPGFGLGPIFDTTILLQVRTQGSEIDHGTVRFVTSAGDVAPAEQLELFRGSAGPGGFIVDTLYRFELSSSWLTNTIKFDASESSMSLDRVAIDAWTHYSSVGGTSVKIDGATSVPVPGTAGVGLVCAGLAAARRRR